MEGSKIIKMFKSLTTEEWKYLRWFVQSDFFNTDPNLLRFYEALAKHYPDFAAKTLSKESLYNKVFGGQAYHDGKWRNLSSKMTKLMEDYLAWLEVEQQETTRQKLLTAAYGRRNLFEQFEKGTNELSEKLEKQAEQSVDALRERVQLNLQYYHHPQTAKVANLTRLQAAMDDLDHYYFAEKLRLACDLKVIENMARGAAPIRLKVEIQALVGKDELRKLPYLELYNRVLRQLEQAAGLEQFQENFVFFNGIAGQLSAADRQFGLLHLLNFAINQANKGEAGYRFEVLKLYKKGLEQGVLLKNDKISANTFINISSYGSAAKEFAWTEEFIANFEDKLEVSVRLETKTISLGFLNFYKKDHTETILLLQNFKFEDFNLVLMSKMLLIRSYFELFEKDNSYFNLFISYSKALDKFIKREKLLSTNKKKWHFIFIGELSRIAKLKNQYKLDTVVKLKLAEEIKSQEMILKYWLLEKIEGL